jgi:3D (Asp-Asp-Asp) domain-containing protein
MENFAPRGRTDVISPLGMPENIMIHIFRMIFVLSLMMFTNNTEVIVENISIDEMESAIEPSPTKYFIHSVTVTGYNATIAQCDSTPNILADNTKINIHKAGSYRICALSRDLLKRFGGKYSFGDTICLVGSNKYSGNWIVRDVMGSRHKNSIDLLVDFGNIPRKYNTQAVRIVRI